MPDDPQLSELKLPPHSIEAEQSVLGGLMLDNEAADRIGDVIGAEDFYADAHRLIYAAATRLIADGRPADVVTVSEALDSMQKLDYVGGLDYLGALVAGVPTAANIRHYATIVRERSILRQLASTAGEIAEAAYHPLGRSAREVLDVAEAKVLHIAEQGTRGQRQYVEIATLLASVVERIEDLYSRDDPSDVTGLATGYADLDRMTAGLQAGDLVIVAGRPSMGKAQPLDAKVLGRHGWKPMGSLEVGDALASIDGEPSLVTGVYPQGEREIFRVAFSDGRSTEVCAEHLWRVHYRGWPAPRTLSTAQVEMLLARVRYRHRLWIDLPSGSWGHDDPLPVDPWIVGALLGDGCAAPTDPPGFTTVAAEMLTRLRMRLPDEMSFAHAVGPGERTVRRSGRRARVQEAASSPLVISLARMGLIGRRGHEKFVPRCYMDANARVRRDVLRGVLDTGGGAERSGAVRYATASRQLAEDVVELARSLGAWASLREKRSRLAHHDLRCEGRAAFVVTIMHPSPRSLFLLSAKGLRAPERMPRLRKPVFTAIEPSGRAPAQCVAVSHPSRLYITDDHVVTHNTAFALNVGEHAALALKKPVAVFSMEMGATQLAMRLIGSVGRLPAQHLRTGRLQPEDWEKLSGALGRLNDAQILIDETPALSAIEVRSRARRIAKQYKGLGLVIVDYLQLMQATTTGENRATEISEISRSMKALAKELQVPVMALSQLNRSLEQRPNKRPVMSDLRECVTGDTLVLLADGRRVPIRALVGTTPEVWAIDCAQRVVAARSDRIWAVGKRPVLRIVLASGRTLRCTGQHRLLSGSGWVRADTLGIGDRMAVARRVPQPMTTPVQRAKAALREAICSRRISLGLAVSGAPASGYSELFDAQEIERDAADGLFWDRIVDVTPDGEEEVFDLTVPGPACWLADGIVSHNSGAIEQDADVIFFIYRDEVYNPDTQDKGIAEVIIGKQRNGPIGTVRLAFLGEYTRFESLAQSGTY